MTDEERPDRPADGPPDGSTDGSTGGAVGGSDDDAVWAALVESFHRSPSLPEAEDDTAGPGEDGPGAAPHSQCAPAGAVAAAPGPPEEHFVPPPPMPGPPLEPVTKLAWLGTLGGPAFLLLVVLIGWEPPRWLVWFAVAGFLAGFVTLVARMRRENDPYDGDDGAVV